jgi:hypothetical protein
MDHTNDHTEEAHEWGRVEEVFRERFGKVPDLEGVLFLIGVQELGKAKKTFTKEQKQDLMHVAVCRLLSRSGYYRFERYDEDGWPHYTELKKITGMTLKEQEDFLKRHVIGYFAENGYLNGLDHPHPNH